uniref:D-2-hydroxyacid dehydrogenase n=1 Tax=Thaumasiovibrio occultus TaxID=1891184 RepID=UPI000B34F3EF|nr:D-2-hydroxyacid dehydrogenase [Thaumasiovibrio occultus]
MTLHIVFLDQDTIPSHITINAPRFAHTWQSYPETVPEEVISRAKDSTILITNKVVLDADTLEQLPKLKLIAVSATGTNNIDLAACRRLDIAVCNVRGYANRAVPEHVIGLIYALRRNFLDYHRDILDGEWQRQNRFCFFSHPIGDVAGSTLGIIGKGELGQAVATLAQAIGMKVLFAEHKGAPICREGYLPFEHVLQQADVLTLHCPLMPDTHHLIGKAELELLPNHAIVINTGRGGLVDENALVEALKAGDIGGAGIDVFTSEPLQDNNPLLVNAHLPHLILTPHVAWGSASAIQALMDQVVENIELFVAGQPRHLV